MVERLQELGTLDDYSQPHPRYLEHDVIRWTHLRRSDFAAWAGERPTGVSAIRSRPSTNPRDKSARPFGLRRGGRPRRRRACPMSRIALRAAPGELARRSATQAGSI